MSCRRTLTAAVLTTSLGMGLGVGAATVANAAPPATTAIPAVSTSLASTTSATTAFAGGLSAALRATSVPTTGTPQPPAAPSQSSLLSLIVTTALAVLRAAAPGTYNQLVNVVSQGMTAFIIWWNTSAPAWAKDLVGTISAVALYVMIRLLLGV